VGGEREGRRLRRSAERRPSPRVCATSARSSTDKSAEGCLQARALAGDDEPLRRVSACGARRGDASAAALAAFLLPFPAVPGTAPTAVAGAHRAEEVPLRGNDPLEGRAQPCRGVGGGPTAAARCACAPAMGRWEGSEWRGESPPCWWHGWGGRLPAGLAEWTQMTKAAVRRWGGEGAGQCRGTEALLFYDSSARARGLWCCCCSLFVARALPKFLREHTVRGCSLRFALIVMCSLAENVCFGRFAHLLLGRVHCTPGRDTTPD